MTGKKMVPLLAVAALGCVALCSCSDGPTVVSDPAVGLVIRGEVTVDGMGVPDAIVRAGIGAGESANCEQLVAAYPADTTNASGEYLVDYVAFGTPFTGCVKVTVVPSGSELLPDSTTQGGIQFRAFTVPDTVQADFQLSRATNQLP